MMTCNDWGELKDAYDGEHYDQVICVVLRVREFRVIRFTFYLSPCDSVEFDKAFGKRGSARPQFEIQL